MRGVGRAWDGGGPFPALRQPVHITWVARHPVAAFLVLGLAASSATSTLMILVERGVLPGRALPSRLGSDMEEATSAVLVLVLAMTALLVTVLADGRPGVRSLLRRATRWRAGWTWWIVAVAALPATTVGLSLAMGDRLEPVSTRTVLGEVFATVVALLAINLAEETAWAGFLQTRLERRHNFFLAAVLASVPFALVHVPIRIVANEIAGPEDVIPQLAALLVLCVIIRTLLGAVVRGTAGSILLVAVTHTSFNRSNNVDGLAADLLIGQAQPLAALTAALVLTMGILLVLRRRLGRGEDLDREDRLTASPNRALSASSP
jgi:membrane protease YdiL (CAAX protease family)